MSADSSAWIADRNATSGATIEVDSDRSDVLKQLFGEVGELIDDFSCAVQSNIILHGRMYVTDRFLCFYSNLFGLEKKIRIPYSHITVMTKENTAFVIPNAIAITTYRKEYLFRSFFNRDDCYNMLKTYVAKCKNKISSSSTSQSAAAGGVRNDDESVASSPTTTSSGADTPVEGVPSSLSLSEQLSPNAPTSFSRPRSGTNRESVPILRESSMIKDDEVDTEIGRKEFDVQADDNDGDNSEQALEQEISKCKMKIVKKCEILDISVGTFMQAFVLDSAPFSWRKHHENKNDSNLEVTSWARVSTVLGYQREMSFLKPVNLPGLKSARGKKFQRYRKFGELGLVVCSSTHLEDVPASDTFSVEDVVAVRAAGEGKISVEISFECKFVKSTMLRYLIESNTNTEMGKWLDEFLAVMKQNASNVSRNPGLLSTGQTQSADAQPMTQPSPALPTAHSPQDQQSTAAAEKVSSSLEGLLNGMGLRPGRTLWAVLALLALTFFYFSFQWQSASSRIAAIGSQVAEVMAGVEGIASRQKLLTERVEGMAAMLSVKKGMEVEASLSGFSSSELSELMRDIRKLSEKLEKLERQS